MNSHERRKLNRLAAQQAQTIAATRTAPTAQAESRVETEGMKEAQKKPNTGPRQPKSRTARRWHIAKRTAKIVGAVIAFLAAILGILTGYLALLPRVSVSQKGALDPSTVFSSPFIISNNGPLPIENVTFRCGIAEVKVHPGLEVRGARNFGTSFIVLRDKNGNIAPQNFGSPEMLPGERSTMPGCSFPWLKPMEHANIGIVVSFRVGYTPFRETRIFPFSTLKDSSGNLHWYPSPVK